MQIVFNALWHLINGQFEYSCIQIQYPILLKLSFVSVEGELKVTCSIG